MEKKSVTDSIKTKAYELGYDLCGAIPADSLKDYTTYLDERVERFPHSRSLYEPLYGLASPDKKEEWAKSTVVCVRRYDTYKIPPGADKYFGKVYLVDGRLAYADEFKKVAFFQEHLNSLGISFFKDFAPARFAAVKAGLGQYGKNNFLYTEYGSWVWIDTWTISAELDYDGPSTPADNICPENCTKCIDACPTKALSEPFLMDRGACISQLSCFSAALPPVDLRDRMGDWIYGCDVCQDVCPKNKGTWAGQKEFPGNASLAEFLTPNRIAEMDETTYLEKIQPRFWYIPKGNIWLWKVNALRSMANSGDPQYHGLIREACSETDDNVKAMAAWARDKLGI
jgi:epoxyqueuosine reductase